jgi:hypothetical protein
LEAIIVGQNENGDFAGDASRCQPICSKGNRARFREKFFA